MIHRFDIVTTCPYTSARTGTLNTNHGQVETPAFMPVASQATVKTMTPDELRGLGVQLIISNTYHLSLRPGIESVSKLGGLHRFMGWDRPIVTDSGGYQLFSLASLCQTKEEGVLFRSHLDGSEHFLTPELATQLQEELGGDIIMPLDDCPPHDSDLRTARQVMERTHRWAQRCQQAHSKIDQALYGIVQGGIYSQLRQESAHAISSLGFPGYAIGGLSLGESKEVMIALIEETVAYLPQDKPHYLMGVGSPEDILEGIARGIDLFDSALPTRIARNGAILTSQGRRNIRNACFKHDDTPIDPQCDCYTCHTFSAAYLHHLFRCEEMLSYRLATIHNLHFIMRLMEQTRQAIMDGTFSSYKKAFLSRYRQPD